MLNSQHQVQPEDHQRQLQLYKEQSSKIITGLLYNDTIKLANNLSISATVVSTASSSETNVYLQKHQLTDNQQNHENDFFTFNDLTAFQPSSSSSSSVSTPSANFINTNNSIITNNIVANNNNNNLTNKLKSSSTNSSNNKIASPSISSSHSSNSTINLNIGISGSEANEHYTQQTSSNHIMNQQHLSSLGSSNYIICSGEISDTSHPHFNQYQQLQQYKQIPHPLQRSLSSASSSLASTHSISLQQQQQYQHYNLNQQQTHHYRRPQLPSSSNSKSCWCFGGDATYHFKTLVPAVAAGAIIGKGGETIASLQRDTGARVKMSKSHDFYPGTSERVCLITGSVEAILTVLDFIMDKIREKPDLANKLSDIETKQAQDRDKQVKILVPNSTAGMIIGKAGAYIKQMKEESGCYVQISQKPKDITLQERCITIIGERDNNKIACKMILSKIVEDPQSGTCLNVSYADINGPVANYNPTGSPYATNQNAISSSTASLNSALSTTVGGPGLLVNGAGINLSLNLGSPNPSPNPAITTQIVDHIKMAMRNSGYSETVTSEVCTALGILAKYGILGVGVGLPHANGAHSGPLSYLGVSALEQSAGATTAGSVFGALSQVNLEQYLGQSTAAPRPGLEAGPFDPFRHAGSQAATPISINNNSFGLAATAASAAQAMNAQTLGSLSKSPTPGDLGAKDTKNVEIPEVIVGAILGPNGRSLIEIQHVSGANIQISKKGIFAPGTRNRIVTITGQPNAIAMAHYLIDQKVTEEEAKRARQNTTTNVIQ